MSFLFSIMLFPRTSLVVQWCRICMPVQDAAAAAVTSVASDSVRPHRRQPTRLPHPWDSPGKNSGVGCHCLLQCMKVKQKSLGHIRLFATPWTAAHQAPPSMGFSRQEYWSGVPWPSPRSILGQHKIQITISLSSIQ